MSESRWVVPFLLAACGIWPGVAGAQGSRGQGPTVMQQPLMGVLANPIFRVSEVGPGGTVRLELRPDLQNLADSLSFIEGHYVLMTGTVADRGQVHLFRA